jgi:hypothetical protein
MSGESSPAGEDHFGIAELVAMIPHRHGGGRRRGSSYKFFLAQSPHVTVVVTPGRGVAMQYRPDLGAPSVQVAVRAGMAPEWVRLTQVEGLFRGYASEDGVTWHLIGEVTLLRDPPALLTDDAETRGNQSADLTK